MKIIQLSDWHIGEQLTNEKEIATELMNHLCKTIKKNEQIAVCICGDIIDKGSLGDAKAKYNNAKEIVRIIKSKLSSIPCEFKLLLVPGNHDIVKRNNRRLFSRPQLENPFTLFCEFACEVTEDNTYSEFLTNSAVKMSFANFDFILCNSAFHGDKRYGQVDPDKVSEMISNTIHPAVVVVHHTLFSDGSADTSVLRNGYQITNAVQDNTLAVLHGHTHGYKNIKIGDRCLVVGVGPFLKNVPDVPKQLNYIDLNSQFVESITNYYWRSDVTPLTKELYKNTLGISYIGSNIKILVDQVSLDIAERGHLHNTTINYHATMEEMYDQIQLYYKEELTTAEEWQANACPKELYYNHGELISKYRSCEYIKEQLMRNPTSRRAMVTLIDQETIQNSGDGFLPSFDVVQFSFPDERRGELIISLYMRALEVEHFLPINICELYLLAKYLREENVTVTSVNLTIFAHRLTIIKGFDAFRKADIDLINDSDMASILSRQDYHEIVRMLKQKKERKETILHLEGISILQSSVISSKLSKKKKNDIQKKIEQLNAAAKEQKTSRTKHSCNYDYERSYAKCDATSRLEKAYSALIWEFEHL